jgi:hypothetical protein
MCLARASATELRTLVLQRLQIFFSAERYVDPFVLLFQTLQVEEHLLQVKIESRSILLPMLANLFDDWIDPRSLHSHRLRSCRGVQITGLSCLHDTIIDLIFGISDSFAMWRQFQVSR